MNFMHMNIYFSPLQIKCFALGHVFPFRYVSISIGIHSEANNNDYIAGNLGPDILVRFDILQHRLLKLMLFSNA